MMGEEKALKPTTGTKLPSAAGEKTAAASKAKRGLKRL